MSQAEFKDILKQRCDIVDILNHYLPLKRQGNTYKALCPFHNEKTPSFTVNPQKQVFYCFGCHQGGDIFQFVMEYEKVSFPECLRILAQRVGIPFPEPGLKSGAAGSAGQDRDQKLQLLELHEQIASWFQQKLRSGNGRVALDYLRQRGLTDDIIVKFGIGYAPDGWRHACEWEAQRGYSPATMLAAGILTVKNEGDPPDQAYDRFRHRLMFPVWNELGKIVGFSGRVLTADAPGGKYVNSPETPIFHKSRILYGLHLAREDIKKQGCALLCEGQMDAIACHQAGLGHAVAPMGTAFTEAQARLLKRYTDRLVVMFDSDRAGIAAAIRSIDAFLPAGLTARVVVLGAGKDPDGVLRQSGAEALRQQIAAAQDYFMFRVDLALQERADDRRGEPLAHLIAPILLDLSRLENAILKAEYCRHIAEKIKVPEDAVRKELERQSRCHQKPHTSPSADRESSPTAPQPSAPAASENAEKVLLEIALHHGVYAHQLLEDLPVEYISDSPAGLALNAILALTEQGNWADAAPRLMGQRDRPGADVVSKAIVAPEFGIDVDKEKLQKAYLDCLYRGMLLPNIEKRIAAVQRLMKDANPDARAEYRQEFMRLRQRKSELHRHIIASTSP